MKSTQKKMIILFIGLFMAFLLNNMLIFNMKIQTDYDIPKQSAGYIESFIYVDGTATGIGAHNWTWAESQLWCSGDGSWSTPYIIENVTIDASSSPTGSGIFIDNSKNDYFIIRNCTVYNAGSATYDAGIRLQYTCNGTIFNNTVSDNDNKGIYLYFGCDNNTITENTINDNADTGIYLLSSCDNNVIKNNTINRNDVGIILYQSDNNNITGNTLKDNSFCIYETSSFGNIIEYNDCSPPTVQVPIFINAAATGVGANNWTWAVSQSWCAGSGTWNDPYIIENLKISGFGTGYGIYIYKSDVSFIIQDCLIYNSKEGIYLENVNNSRLINNNCSNINWGILLEDSNNNTISGNTANGNNYEGIYLTYANNNTLSGNTANDNEDLGIHLQTECMNNTLSGNTINNNGDSGIHIEEDCMSNTISRNIANNNTYNGIYMYDECYYNTISNNFVNSSGEYGISIHWYSQNNTIIDNIANYNENIGIELYDFCSNNTVSNNVVSYNGLSGIGIFDFSDNNILTENILYNNTIGVYIDTSDNNSIYENFFLKNGKHAFDYGIDNMWNSTTIGNYWDNWTSPDVSPNDGIVDLPYNISGPAGSIDYLPIAEDGAPSITINSPTSSDVFGVNAPSFDVTITDVYVDSMWYTIDGGINNYTFIENGIIHQSAWNAMPDGAITLTFYASDIINNIGIAEVTVVKDTIGPNIIINSPSSGSQFGVNAPAFIITVNDESLDSMWYSLDGGLTTHAITTNATIDQTAWTALSEGSITITFYANDTLGNLSFEEVTITKNIPSGGIDPIMVIVIIVVSVVGGVAVIAGVYIFMKKRAAPE